MALTLAGNIVGGDFATNAGGGGPSAGFLFPVASASTDLLSFMKVSNAEKEHRGKINNRMENKINEIKYNGLTAGRFPGASANGDSDAGLDRAQEVFVN